MPDVERVAARCRPHQISGEALQPTAERFLHQAQALLLAEWRQPQPFEVAVLPQRRDRVGHGFAVPDRRHDPHRPFQCQLMHERRREVIQQVRVIDADNRMLSTVDRFARGGQAGDRITRRGRANQMREDTQRNRPGGSVPATQCTGVGSDWVTARAKVVLPTPASPNSTIPAKSCVPARAERIVLNSSSRRTIGQDRVSTTSDNTAIPE